jgi:hypothetical protein
MDILIPTDFMIVQVRNKRSQVEINDYYDDADNNDDDDNNLYSEDGGSRLFQIIGIYLQDYTVSQAVRPQSHYLQPERPQILHQQ